MNYVNCTTIFVFGRLALEVMKWFSRMLCFWYETCGDSPDRLAHICTLQIMDRWQTDEEANLVTDPTGRGGGAKGSTASRNLINTQSQGADKYKTITHENHLLAKLRGRVPVSSEILIFCRNRNGPWKRTFRKQLNVHFRKQIDLCDVFLLWCSMVQFRNQSPPPPPVWM